jgi:hypothetical protein
VVSRELAHPGLAGALLALTAVELAVVAKTATARHEGGLAIALALALAPIAVAATAALATRVAGRRFALGAAVVYVALPLLGRLYVYGPFVSVYDHKVVPALVGLEHTGWFALGIGVALLVAVVPERISAVAGVVGAVIALVLWVDGPWRGLWGNFHETTWSPTLLTFLPVAVLVGVARRSPWLAAALGGWLAVVVLRGVHRDYGSGGFWLSLAAAAPAIAVLLSSLAFLVPRLRAAPAPDPAH